MPSPASSTDARRAAPLPDTMHAVVCHGPGDYRLEQVATPRPGPRELILKIHACGICGSDLKCRDGAAMYWGDGERFDAFVKPPMIVGHEFAGEIVALGEGAAEHFGGVTLGQRVVPEQIIPCRQCFYCQRGHYWMCEVHHIFGFQGGVADGGMAEYLRVPEHAVLHPVDPRLSVEDAAFLEPLACGIHAVNRAEIQFDDTVVIAGGGPIGLAMVQLARLKTPKRLILVDTHDDRLELAREYGAEHLFNPHRDDIAGEVRALTNGYGCDVYIDATGSPSGVIQGLEALRKLGRFVEFSVFKEPTQVDWSTIGDRKELDIRGSHLSPHTYPVAIDLLARGLVTTRGIVTHRVPLSDFERGFEIAARRDSIKVVLTQDA
ncbi:MULTISPECIES: alcohol dehydrogenase catalytic domain-containing protein [unclassified Salinicola]|uniref:zinc-binding dehydrogenase n=1 Tax=unclassified Salinicola TaxID=2634022 RepID=UPI001A8CDE88|nr:MULTISPECIES: alcohol dehydrogenase catalytic domain-containing protein [unclassified Salinicola]MCE3028416.1 alcohol dehydrogenase catalytic domain-containing protein [Salinicola sp. DM10]WIX33473.1 alcohol dehydrogenase catalytic domain-containing protein [Salinicola sp. JS01]